MKLTRKQLWREPGGHSAVNVSRNVITSDMLISGQLILRHAQNNTIPN